MRSDLIIVMEDGRFVEQGQHEQLLAMGGSYADLYRTQFLEHNDPVASP